MSSLICLFQAIANLVYFPDHDKAGEKKAQVVLSACQQVNLPCLILSPTDVWSQMPHKGDITDFVEAHSNLSTNESISRLEKAIARSALAKPIALAHQRNEKKNRDREEQEQLFKLVTIRYS